MTTECPGCGGHHDPGECRASDYAVLTETARRERVVKTARAIFSNIEQCTVEGAFVLAREFEFAAEKYLRG